MKRNGKSVEYYRSFSLYLNPKNRNAINGSVMIGNVDDIQHHLGQVKPRIKPLEKELKGVDAEYKRYQAYQLQIGSKPVTEMPPEMVRKQEEIYAQIEVKKEEISWLKTKLKEAKAQIKTPERKPISHRKDWASAVLKNNIMRNIGGHETSVGKDGVLFISDDRSAYDGMKVWEFKSRICNPMGHEYRRRVRLETKAALYEKRDVKRTGWPDPPLYDKKTGKVKYPGYSESVIKKYQTT